jgi:hypothetical protein
MWRMNTTRTSRLIQTALLCLVLLSAPNISFAARSLLSAQAKDVGGDRTVDLDAPTGQYIITERRQCRYEQHECQLMSGL